MSTTTPHPPTETSDRIAILRRAPVFASMTGDALAALAPRFHEACFDKGQTVVTEGDEADAFFVVARGELEVWGGEPRGHVVNRLRPGDHLGEVALLVGGRRTATVTAARPALLLVLDKHDFLDVLYRDAKVLGYLARVLSHQLDERTRGEVAARTTVTIAVSGEPGVRGRTFVAEALAAVLGRQLERDVVVIGGHGARRPSTGVDAGELRVHGRVAHLALDGEDGDLAAQRLAALVDRLGERFPAIVLDAGPWDAPAAAHAAALCDVAVELLAGPDTAMPARHSGRTRVLRVLNCHNQHVPAVPIDRSEPFVIPDDPPLAKLSPSEAARRIVGSPNGGAARPIHRMARTVRGTSIGVALGGGAALGVSHIGVLRVLEEAGVPVDVVAGTSMGSIIGLAYASGRTPAELVEFAHRVGTKRAALSALDVTIFRPGLLAGDRLKAVFAPLMACETFEDLALPCQTVATDIETGERVCIGEGSLLDALRASASVPMVWAPVRRDGHVLVDGGVVDPVPAGVVKDMGADVVIAVNVVPTVNPNATPFASRVSHAVNTLNPLSYLNGAHGMPATFDIVMHSLQMLEYELGNYKAMSADVLVNVDASDFTWTDFHRAAELIEQGARATRRALPAIREALARRPTLAP